MTAMESSIFKMQKVVSTAIWNTSTENSAIGLTKTSVIVMHDC